MRIMKNPKWIATIFNRHINPSSPSENPVDLRQRLDLTSFRVSFEVTLANPLQNSV